MTDATAIRTANDDLARGDFLTHSFRIHSYANANSGWKA